MTRDEIVKFTKSELDKHSLKDWHVRLTTDLNSGFLGLCSHQDKCIILNAHHIDIHPIAEVKNTILHEIAHALTLGEKHSEIWAAKAREIGCDNTQPCSHLEFSPAIIDAIRSGATIEVDVEEQVIRTPKYKVTRLQDKCPECGKVAKEKFNIELPDKDGNIVRLITLECFHVIKKIIPRGTPFETFTTFEHKNNKCKHEWDKNHCVKCDAYKLFDFQIAGARFIESALSVQKGAGVFDEMGLGKTVQSLAYINFHPENTPVLFIVKSGIKFQWFKEIIRWLGPSYLAQVISTSKDYVFPGLKAYIISYDLLRRFPREKIQALKVKLVILDECQQIKNPDSSRTQEVRKIVANPETKVIPLSGTPWKNRGSEFFPVLNMLSPQKFYSHQGYLDTWVEYYWHGNKRKEGGIKNVARFKNYVEDIIIRRERTEVMKELPLINRMKLHVQLDAISQSTYDDEVSDFVKWYNTVVIGGEEDTFATGTALLAKLARMRHITGLSKIPATCAFVDEFVEETDRKLVIFVHHKDVGHILYETLTNSCNESNKEFHELAQLLKDENIPVMKLTAELSSEERFSLQEEFNKYPRAILIASTLASGEGLNLQTCADCVMHERQWNPANEEQAEGRFIRIGQTSNTVNGTYVEAEGTVDEHLDGIIERKRLSFHSAMNRGEAQKWNQGELVKELAETIVRKFREKTEGKKEFIVGGKRKK